MKRIVEPELMEEEAQSLAYAEADFEQPHSYFIQLFQEKFANYIPDNVLDLGCGTGDITLRFAKAYSDCNIHGIDGSKTMLAYAYKDLANCHQNVIQRVKLIEGILPEISLPLSHYDVIISNSLLHHLHDPFVLWRSLRQYSQPGTKIFIMDLLRPESMEEADKLVKNYAQNEQLILQRDFFNSLCAAFSISEVKEQLLNQNLDYLFLEQISDRHFIIFGEYQ
ncbi:class I SAM-dependent methyltransferase [Aphanothece sacrum]|nr:class I SAM-dependent methyltransferase [Aphanothece sacrum]